MDALDERILSELRENARGSFTAIGRAVGLSANAVAARVKRLEADRIIAGYTIVAGSPSPSETTGLSVFIDVRLDSGTDSSEFARMLRGLGHIREAIHVTGPYDYLLRAHVHDPQQLDRLLRRLKTSCGALQTQTRLALARVYP